MHSLLNKDIWDVIRSYSYPFRKARTYSRYWDCDTAIWSRNYSLILHSEHISIKNVEPCKIVDTDRLDLLQLYFSSIPKNKISCSPREGCIICLFSYALRTLRSAEVCEYLFGICRCKSKKAKDPDSELASDLLRCYLRDLELESVKSLVNKFSITDYDFIGGVNTGLLEVVGIDRIGDVMSEKLIKKTEKKLRYPRNRRETVRTKLAPTVMWLHDYIVSTYPEEELSKFYYNCLWLACRLQDRDLTEWLCRTLPKDSRVRSYSVKKLMTPADPYILDLLYDNGIAYSSCDPADIYIKHLIRNDELETVKWLIAKYPLVVTRFSPESNGLISFVNRNTKTMKFIFDMFGEKATTVSSDIFFQYGHVDKDGLLYRLFSDAVNSRDGDQDMLSKIRIYNSEAKVKVKKTKTLLDCIYARNDLLKRVLKESVEAGDTRCARLVATRFKTPKPMFKAVHCLPSSKASANPLFILLLYRIAYSLRRNENIFSYTMPGYFDDKWLRPENSMKTVALIKWYHYALNNDILDLFIQPNFDNVDIVSNLPKEIFEPFIDTLFASAGPNVFKWLMSNNRIPKFSTKMGLPVWNQVKFHIWSPESKDLNESNGALSKFINFLSKRMDLKSVLRDFEDIDY